jgi:hypothetical protein
MTQWFIPWFGQVQHLPTPRCGVPTDEGCNQPLSSGPKTHLNTTMFCFHFTISRLRGISTNWSLSPLHFEVHKEAQSKGGICNAHKTQNRAPTRTQVTTRAHNTTRRVHNSNGALVAITKNQMHGIEVLVLRNALRMLDILLHAPRGPFYSPKAARSR